MLKLCLLRQGGSCVRSVRNVSVARPNDSVGVETANLPNLISELLNVFDSAHALRKLRAEPNSANPIAGSH